MFAKTSRYWNLPDITTLDDQGRPSRFKALRLLPEAPGTFLHQIEEADRLDHLAYRYYNQSAKWWRICDANPEFMSPWALLGKESLKTDLFPLHWSTGAQPPAWGDLRRTLEARPGVLDIQIIEEVPSLPETRESPDEPTVLSQERLIRAVRITYNVLNIGAETLMQDLKAAGFAVGRPQPVGRIGKKIVIPPDMV